MHSLLVTSFIAGLLTVLAPCVLPLLPVIISGTAGSSDRRRPFVITFSLACSIVLFTVLLKASTTLVAVPQATWTLLSGVIILFFGIVTVWPNVWDWLSVSIGLSSGSQGVLSRAGQQQGLFGAALLGAALGPVFSSCSPTYFVILATVLPVSFATGVLYLVVYAIGITIVLTAVALLGQRFTAHVRWATHPHGWFRRGLGVLLVLVGLAIVTGYDKKIELAALDTGFNITKVEEYLLGTQQSPSPVSVTDSRNMLSLPVLYPAPELSGLTHWLNTAPIASLQDLRGKIVLVDFWTYSCVNCIRTLPYLEAWHEKYADKGLVILGIHAPEFQFERVPANVAKAVQEFGLKYPVAQDNDFATWRAYRNQYWPAKYLIDQSGLVRYTHFGEGNYTETEMAIATLLGEKSGIPAAAVSPSQFVGGTATTPETYLGTDRRARFVPSTQPLASHEWTLTGSWHEGADRITTAGADAVVRLQFTARQANLVLGGVGLLEVWLDGVLITVADAGKDVRDGVVTLDGERLYQLTNLATPGAHMIELRFRDAGIAAYAWTFG